MSVEELQTWKLILEASKNFNFDNDAYKDCPDSTADELEDITPDPNAAATSPPKEPCETSLRRQIDEGLGRERLLSRENKELRKAAAAAAATGDENGREPEHEPVSEAEPRAEDEPQAGAGPEVELEPGGAPYEEQEHEHELQRAQRQNVVSVRAPKCARV